MKHLGPLRPDRPARRYWRDVGLAFAGAAGWMLLNALVGGGIVSQAIMLVIVIIAVPTAIYAASALRHSRSMRHTPGSSLERQGLMGLNTVWPLGTVWVIDNTPEARGQRAPIAPSRGVPPEVRRRLRKDEG